MKVTILGIVELTKGGNPPFMERLTSIEQEAGDYSARWKKKLPFTLTNRMLWVFTDEGVRMFAEVRKCFIGKVVLKNEQINDQQIVEISGRRNNKIKVTVDEVQLVCRKWALNLRRWVKALNARAEIVFDFIV